MSAHRVVLTNLMIFVMVVMLSPSLYAGRETPDWDDVYTIGIIEPYNRTEIAGRLEIAPLFVEKMDRFFTDAHYRVIRISNESLYHDGYRIYHESEPDTPLDAKQIVGLGEKYRIDALATGTIFEYQKRSKAEFFHMKEFWKVSLEGVLYSTKTGRPWLKIPLRKEERINLDTGSPPWQKQVLDVDIQAITELNGLMLDQMGRKPADTEPPVIDIKKPQDAQVMHSSVTLLLGEVNDKSKVLSLRINGEEKEIVPGRVVKLYYPVSYMHGKEKEHSTLSVVARDIYGNTSSRTIGLTWGKPVWGQITKIEGREVQINVGTAHGVATGMTFMACNVETYRDPVTGLNMFNFIEVGPIVVTKAYINKSDCTFMSPEKAERMKKGDVVR